MGRWVDSQLGRQLGRWVVYMCAARAGDGIMGTLTEHCLISDTRRAAERGRMATKLVGRLLARQGLVHGWVSGWWEEHPLPGATEKEVVLFLGQGR